MCLNSRLRCIFRFSENLNANIQYNTHNDRHFCRCHNRNGPSLCVYLWAHECFTTVLACLSHLWHNVCQRPQYNLTNLLMIHTHTHTLNARAVVCNASTMSLEPNRIELRWANLKWTAAHSYSLSLSLSQWFSRYVLNVPDTFPSCATIWY